MSEKPKGEKRMGDQTSPLDIGNAGTPAWSAYEAVMRADGREPDADAFEGERTRWEAAAAAVTTCVTAADPHWPLKARVWTRTSVEPHEKVLEISGVIDDTHLTCRHTQSLAVADADVPGLPEMYPDQNVPSDASAYVRALAETKGLEGMEREARRLLHKITTAASLNRQGQMRTILSPSDGMARRVDDAVASRSMAWLARELDSMQARIVKAQEIAHPDSITALVLHTDEEHWPRHPSYSAYLRRFDVNY